jgi:hypothetical protein
MCKIRYSTLSEIFCENEIKGFYQYCGVIDTAVQPTLSIFEKALTVYQGPREKTRGQKSRVRIPLNLDFAKNGFKNSTKMYLSKYQPKSQYDF